MCFVNCKRILGFLPVDIFVNRMIILVGTLNFTLT